MRVATRGSALALAQARAVAAALPGDSDLVEITTAGMRESHVHDVQITKEAPNYHVE